MIKAERDQIMQSMAPEERSQFRQVLREDREEYRASSARKISEVWKPRASQYSSQLQGVVEAVFRRDDMGPTPGELPPDFDLKALGSNNRVRLSSFKNKRPVAIAFGSYT